MIAESGRALAAAYHEQVVRPLLLTRWPRLPYAAARLGSGSDVLGLDDQRSRDHDWGLRLNVLVPADLVEAVEAHLEAELPTTYAGLPTRFAVTWDPVERQRVQVDDPGEFARSRLGLDPRAPMTVRDWLSLTGQSVLEVTAGPVLVDDAGELTAIRAALTWYPDPMWRYLVACDWARLAQEMPVMSRAGDRGDDLGSRVVAARMVGVVVHLGFLLERRWAPYPKWRGTVFATLPSASAAAPNLAGTLAAGGWQERQGALTEAVEVMHRLQGEVGLPADGPAITAFWDRPYLTVPDETPVRLLATVEDPEVAALPLGVGSVEQWVDNVDVLTRPDRRRSATEGVRRSPD